MEPSSHATSSRILALQESSDLAHWLAGVLAGEPGAERQLFAATGNRGMEEAVQALRVQLKRLEKDDEPAPWEPERIRLFVNAPGGIPLPPYGSWWIDGELMGASSIAVAKFYRQEGLRTASRGGPPDYLPAELEFLHFLLQHQIAALRTHQGDLVEHALWSEGQFLDRFLLSWIPRFCQKGLEVSRDPFWSAVFTLLDGLIRREKERLDGEETG